MLDLVEHRIRMLGASLAEKTSGSGGVSLKLEHEGRFEVVKLTGDMSLAERRSILNAFKTNPSVKVLVWSLLNSQGGGHAFASEQPPR